MSNLKGIDKYKDELIKNARYIVQKGKGILAADESTGTIGKRFAGANVENTEKNRRAYRELLFTTPGLEQYISGTILYDETVYQKTKEGKRFIEVLSSKVILPGIKVDKGTIPIINSVKLLLKDWMTLGKDVLNIMKKDVDFQNGELFLE